MTEYSIVTCSACGLRIAAQGIGAVDLPVGWVGYYDEHYCPDCLARGAAMMAAAEQRGAARTPSVGPSPVPPTPLL